MQHHSSFVYRQEAYFGYVKWQKRRGPWKKLFLLACALGALAGTALFLLFAFSKDPFLGYVSDDAVAYVHIALAEEDWSRALENDINRWMGFEGEWNAGARAEAWMVSQSGERAAFFRLSKDANPDEIFSHAGAGFSARQLGRRVYVFGDDEYVSRIEKHFLARPSTLARNVILAWRGRAEADAMFSGSALSVFSGALPNNDRMFGKKIFAYLKRTKDGSFTFAWQGSFAEIANDGSKRLFDVFPKTSDGAANGVAFPVAAFFRGFDLSFSALMNTRALSSDGWQWFVSREEGKDPASPLSWRLLGAAPLQNGTDETAFKERLETFLRDIAATVVPEERSLFLPDGSSATEIVKNPTSFIFEEKDGFFILKTVAGEFFYRIVEKEGARFVLFGNAPEWQGAFSAPENQREDFAPFDTLRVCENKNQNDVLPSALRLSSKIFQGKSDFLANFREISIDFHQKIGCLN